MDFYDDISGIEMMLFLMMIGIWMIWKELWNMNRDIQKMKSDPLGYLRMCVDRLEFINENLQEQKRNVDKKLDKILFWMEDNNRQVGHIELDTREINESVTKIKENEQVI
jgi:hypothetical protein